MSSELNEETTKDLMIKLFPKSEGQHIQQRKVVSHPSHNQRIQHRPQSHKNETVEHSSKPRNNKMFVAIVLAIVSVFILSPYVLNRIDDIASNRGYTLFNSKGEPSIIFLGVLVLIIGVINRVILGFI